MTDSDKEARVGGIRENFPGFFDKPDQVYPYVPPDPDEASAEDGFPDVLNLSSYYQPSPSGTLLVRAEGMSIFMTAITHKDVTPEVYDNTVNDEDYTSENAAKIASMTADEVIRAQDEILLRFDPATVRFLRNRKRSTATKAQPTKKPSKFRQSRMNKDEEKSTEVVEENMETESVKNLEFFRPDEGSLSTDEQRFARLATNAVQMDLASKSYGMTAPRHAHAWLSIFDKLKKLELSGDEDPLIQQAVNAIDRIKELYTEEIMVAENNIKCVFANDVSPASDGSWLLVPIRRVLDAVEESRPTTADDVDIVRLTLLFSLLFVRKQATLLEMFGSPSDLLCRLAEVFLLGPEVFTDTVVDDCISALLDEYFVPAGIAGKLTFATAKPIARLDAFLPFFYDLLKNFEQYGGGYTNFARTLFMFSCMNNVVHDSLLFLINIWAPNCLVVRSCDLSKQLMQPMLDCVVKCRTMHDYFLQNELFGQYSKLLALYAARLRNGDILPDRNPAMFALASNEIGHFVKFWTGSRRNVGEYTQEVDLLVQMLRHSTKEVLSL